MRRNVVILIAGAMLLAGSAAAQDTPRRWTFKNKFELRANVRDSSHYRFPLRFHFPPDFLPVGESVGYEETVNAGTHAEVSLATLQFEAAFGEIFAARAKVDGFDLYNRNPTSGDRKIDADELWLRYGEMPEGLSLPSGTSAFVLVGKAPKMERQPVRLLESYGLSANSFNRFNDVQFLVGGSFGRHFYWRAQLSSGNPIFFRDANALAGDNGTKILLTKNPNPRLKSGFPIFYDAEVEGYFFSTQHMERGFGAGYRWARIDGRAGVDVIVFDYRRKLLPHVDLYGTFYGGDLDLLDGAFGISLPLKGHAKRESGVRVYAEWDNLSFVGQFVDETLAGLNREGYEGELGYRFDLTTEVYLQPAVRFSLLDNHFRGPREFVAPSVWWDWKKLDVGVRVGLPYHLDLTLEHSHHKVKAPVKGLNMDESLATVRLRL